jgi:hypothetical protein
MRESVVGTRPLSRDVCDSRRVGKRTNSTFENPALVTRCYSEVLGDGWESTKCLTQIVYFIFVSR